MPSLSYLLFWEAWCLHPLQDHFNTSQCDLGRTVSLTSLRPPINVVTSPKQGNQNPFLRLDRDVRKTVSASEIIGVKDDQSLQLPRTISPPTPPKKKSTSECSEHIAKLTRETETESLSSELLDSGAVESLYNWKVRLSSYVSG